MTIMYPRFRISAVFTVDGVAADVRHVEITDYFTRPEQPLAHLIVVEQLVEVGCVYPERDLAVMAD